MNLAPKQDRRILRKHWPAGLPAPRAAVALALGVVARTWLVVLADGRSVVAKLGPNPADAEVDGLQAMARAGVPVPDVLGVAGRLLVLERLSGPTDWAAFGRTVAAMHEVGGPAYGWHRGNHSGRFVQVNDWQEDWPAFFAEQRVRVHLEDPAVDPALARRLHLACDGPLRELLPARPRPVLTHGDLWSGNVVAGAMIDPEVCFGDRELDLVCLEMDRRLPPACLAAYRELLPDEPGYAERRPVISLHHRLLQVRHFGPERNAQVAEVLDRYGW